MTFTCPDCGAIEGTRGKPFNLIGIRTHLSHQHGYSGAPLRKIMANLTHEEWKSKKVTTK